jgi:putative membrane protein
VNGPSRETRIAGLALAGHLALLVFSGLAFATFLAPPAPAWLLTPANQRIAAFMFVFGGQTTVVLGAIAGLLHAAGRLGWRTALAVFAASFSISLASELTGTTTGYPFGPYSYTTQLG